LPKFTKSVLIDAPASDVFAFHERDDAFELLTPPFPPVRVVSKSGGIGNGARVELRVGPFRWVALHSGYFKDRLFIDEQMKGPFAKWVHRHEFLPQGAKTLLTDRVEYRLPGGPVVNRLLGWTVAIGLNGMFEYRHRVTREMCEKRK
jgi:ligand-binding SRPBCC domain-containing protein